jgi:hypothetical protein
MGGRYVRRDNLAFEAWTTGRTATHEAAHQRDFWNVAEGTPSIARKMTQTLFRRLPNAEGTAAG